jgi:uncharacterized protein (TIGR03083 family)
MREARRDLLAMFGGLSAEQWNQQTLCEGWTVRDVAAHLLIWDGLLLYRTRLGHLRRLVSFAGLYAASFGTMTRLNRRLAARTATLSSDEIVERFGADDDAALKWLFDGTNPGAHLAEYVIHHQDIAVPLGLQQPVPSERLISALNGVTKLPSLRWPAWQKLRSRRWQATDLDWSKGNGTVTTASADRILMVLAGRPSAPSSNPP